MPNIRLINPRGRVIIVDEKEVKKLLSRGFLRAPDQSREYNPIFDKGDGVEVPEIVELKEIKKGEKGKILEVTRIQ